MSDSDLTDSAQQRLLAAIEALEAAAERRREADRGVQSLASQIESLGADRSRLASELDDATARSRALESANRDVAQRIDQVIDTIRGVLDAES